MRIGVDIRSLLDQETGGVATYTEQLLINLAKIDTVNDYFLFYNVFQKEIDSVFKKKFSAPNFSIKSFHFPNKIFNSSLNYLCFPKIDRLIGGVDLFFIPNLIFLALSRKIKKVITLHDLSFLLYPQFYSVKGRWWHKAVNPKKIIQDFDQVIAVSESTRNDIINLLEAPPEKVKIIYSGINPENYQSLDLITQAKVKKKYQLPEKFILSLSAIEPRKNIDSLISSFKLFKQRSDSGYHLVIVGGYREKINGFRFLINNSQFKEQVHFIGYVSNQEKPYFYNLASLFVYPSFYEGFGFPPLEAMAASTPVIASYSSSLSEICEEAAILIDPHNIEELTEAIYQVLSNSEFSKRLVAKGLKQVQKYSWRETAQATLDLFESLVDDK
ncbi:MAG: hypothetical protein COT24_00325 [Candidatus Kerfeldbacteria bacterium CG08_land_8_20_14_0_20_40_16]|uniref:Glycosyltransferase family 1 protein n=1 Tax=Candidatus Kerfeldbacteria bacterium CG08_land_8_20_14_0_20_40_16 TaxID=2014244 RepID=A0A2H0YX31_9BACT|nr:MAG: hypothetical protein COT24_00325 [Candidatus Kerfeldbacteria bacterium CG08_land_8_20_14_0_20_40_16]